MKAAIFLAILALVSTFGCAPTYVEKSNAPNEVEHAIANLADTEHVLYTMGSPNMSWTKFHFEQFETLLNRAETQIKLVKETYGRDAVLFMGSTSVKDIRLKLQTARSRLKQVRDEFIRLESENAVQARVNEIQKVLSNDLGQVVELGVPDSTWSDVRLIQFEVILTRLDKEDQDMNERRVKAGLEPWPSNQASQQLWKALREAKLQKLKEPAGGA